MVRCFACGKLVKWSSVALVPCPHCGAFLVMPSEQDARNKGYFVGVTPPYVWELREDEIFLLIDALKALMKEFQKAIPQAENKEVFEALTGSFVYARMTRKKLLDLVPDIKDQIESVDG